MRSFRSSANVYANTAALEPIFTEGLVEFFMMFVQIRGQFATL